MRALLALLSLLALGAAARADAPRERSVRTRVERLVERALADSSRELARGAKARAERVLANALARAPAVPLIVRYGELALPLSAPRGIAATTALEGPARTLAQAFERSDLTAYDAESARVARLYAAFAEVVSHQPERGLELLLAGGRLQDALTVRCVRAIAAVFTLRDELARAEDTLSLGRQYMLQDLSLLADLGRVQLARGKSELAVRMLRERFAVEPRSLTARRDLAYALLASGAADEAIALLEAAQSECGSEATCALEAARAALEAERSDRAIAYARLVRERRPADVDALFLLADAHLRRGELGAAKAAYHDVLRVQPGSVRAKLALEQLATSDETR